jgi:hypothetical protein
MAEGGALAAAGRRAGRLIGPEAEAADYAPFLRWLLVNTVAAVGVAALWHLGLLQLMLRTDRTHMSLMVVALLVVMIGHCLVQSLRVSRELAAVRRIEAMVAGARGFELAAGGRAAVRQGPVLPDSALAAHVANLVAKARAQAGRTVDQTLLLQALADDLRRRERLGWFVSEALLRLALLGTAIGFILMLVPIAGLTAFDADTLRGALAGMTGGMAVALTVTVAGIGSALLLKLEYFYLHQAIGELIARITTVTEVHVVSVLGDG